MLKMIAVLFFELIFFSAHASLYLDAAVGIGFGNAELRQTESPNDYQHEGFIMNSEASFRAGFSYLGFSLGGVYQFGKFYGNFTREDSTSSTTGQKKYDSSFTQQNCGAFVGYNFIALPIRLWAEYYPISKLSVSYADSDVANPFSKGDKFDGTGFGVGVGFKVMPMLYIYGMYKMFEFDQWDVNGGVKRDLPDDSFSKLKIGQGTAGVAIFGDFF